MELRVGHPQVLERFVERESVPGLAEGVARQGEKGPGEGRLVLLLGLAPPPGGGRQPHEIRPTWPTAARPRCR
jgi:hypothetical protein